MKHLRPNLGGFIGASIGANFASLLLPTLQNQGKPITGAVVFAVAIVLPMIVANRLWLLLKMDQRYLFMRSKRDRVNQSDTSKESE